MTPDELRKIREALESGLTAERAWADEENIPAHLTDIPLIEEALDLIDRELAKE